MAMMEGSGGAKSTHRFTCVSCDFRCCKKSLYVRHLTTVKHSLSHNGNGLEIMDKVQSIQKPKPTYICECKKIYSTNSGLWKHKQKCKPVKEPNTEESVDSNNNPKKYEELIMNLLTQNIELQKQVIELCKEKSITVNNTTNNNQKFNMNFFLNEQCKDALDIMDFVNSLQLNLSDLEHTGNVGYVKGVSDIFLRGLRELDVYKRPIHCSDLKREVMYVKDNDVWEKDEDKKKMKKAIHYIAGRNFKQIHEWMDKNPDARDIKTKKHNQYMTIVNKCTGGFDAEEDDILFNKVITNVAKEVLIEKQ